MNENQKPTFEIFSDEFGRTKILLNGEDISTCVIEYTISQSGGCGGPLLHLDIPVSLKGKTDGPKEEIE